MGNVLNSDVKLAAQIVLGLAILIITLLLALPRFQQVESVLELISEVLGTLDRIVVLLLRLISGLHQIISMADEGFQQVVSVLEVIHNVVGSLVNFVVLLLLLIRICRRIGPFGLQDNLLLLPMTTRTKSHLLVLTMARMVLTMARMMSHLLMLKLMLPMGKKM